MNELIKLAARYQDLSNLLRQYRASGNYLVRSPNQLVELLNKLYPNVGLVDQGWLRKMYLDAALKNPSGSVFNTLNGPSLMYIDRDVYAPFPHTYNMSDHLIKHRMNRGITTPGNVLLHEYGHYLNRNDKPRIHRLVSPELYNESKANTSALRQLLKGSKRHFLPSARNYYQSIYEPYRTHLALEQQKLLTQGFEKKLIDKTLRRVKNPFYTSPLWMRALTKIFKV